MRKCVNVNSIQVYKEYVSMFLVDLRSGIYPEVIFTEFLKYSYLIKCSFHFFVL